MAAIASLRSNIAYQQSGSTISTGSIYTAGIGNAPTWTNSLVSSMVSIGASTNSLYTTMTQGNYVSSISTNSWTVPLSTLVSTKTVSMSANAQTQLVVTQVSTATSVQYTSTLGLTWTTLSGATGLPSGTTTNYSAGAVSGDGRYGILAASGGYLYTTANGGSSWTNTNPGVPTIYLPFETAPVNGASGGTTLTVSASVPGIVPGIVGKNALNLVNASPGTGTAATQFLTGSWTVPSNFTVSFWFNPQSAAGSQYIFFVNGTMTVQLGGFGAIQYYTSTGVNISTSYPVAVNTWYNVTAIYQASGVCSLYVNNALIGIQTSNAAITASSFILGQRGDGYAFNGYIDDLKIYNSAITFSPMVPQNWSNVAVSNSGQYMLATGTGLYLSSNFGSSWTQVTSAMLSALWSSVQVSATGQYMLANSPVANVQPQLAGLVSSGINLTTNPWQTGGITWIASTSSTLSGYPVSAAFDTLGNTWWGCSAPNATYTTSTNSSAFYTTIVGIGSIQGDWVQIQSSVPLQMYSYQLGNGGGSQMVKNFYIVGSTDNTNWYPIQRGTIAAIPVATYALTEPILVNSSATQTIGTSTIVKTIYETTTTVYTYFRIVCTTNFNTSQDYVTISEWVINFTAGGQTYSTNYGANWNNGYSIPSNVLVLSPSGQYALSAPLITPQQTGLATNAWNQHGINWTASASSSYNANYPSWFAFNTITFFSGGIYSWASSLNYLAGTGIYNNTYNNSTTLSQSGGTITSPSYGEYLQLQSSVPLIMYSYNLACGNSTNVPKTYVIAGSSDNITYYPLQSVNIGATNPFTTSTTLTSPPILINGPTSQTMNGGTSVTITCTNYTTATTAYTYFRIIANSVYGTSGNAFELSEWYVNFLNANGGTTYNVVPSLQAFSTGTSTSGSVPGIITGSAVSNTGQYMVLITNATSGNNVYYSINYGSTFTGLQLGSSAMTSAAISYDGSYITVANATTVYQLNNNASGYTVAVGNQAGQVNQGVNAIAIGNYAGNYYQYNNSIILNASGSALNSSNQGFYVAPIASYTASSSRTLALLGTGTDNQVVQSGVTFSSTQQTIYGEWIQYQLATPVSITSYVLHPRSTLPDRYPIAWTLAGSVDGVNWNVLDTQSGKTNTLWGISYAVSGASPVYSYFRIIFTQVNNLSIGGYGHVDFGGFILYDNGGPIFGPFGSYTLSAARLQLLNYNSVPVCTLTFSWGSAASFGVIADGLGSSAGYLPTSNGYTQGPSYFLGFVYILTGSTLEYSSPNYIATQGTSTIITAPLIQTKDLTGNTKHQSSSLISLDVNGITRTQQLEFLDGSNQNTASSLEPLWGYFAQSWLQTPLVSGAYYVSMSASGQYISMINDIAVSTISISSNYGQTWTVLASNTNGIGINTFRTMAVSGNGQYQLTSPIQSTLTVGYIYISSTYGQTWSPYTISTGPIGSVAVSYTGQYQLAVPSASSGYVYTSSSYGQSWDRITVGFNVNAVGQGASMSASGQYQMIITTSGIVTSSTYGQTWIVAQVANDLNGCGMSSTGQYQLTPVYTGGGYLSSNYGQNFSAITFPGGGALRDAAVSSTGQYMVVSNGSVIYYSTSYGTTWSSTIIGGGPAIYTLAMSASGQYMVGAGTLAYLSTIPMNSRSVVQLQKSMPMASISNTWGTSAMPSQMIVDTPDGHRLYIGSYWTAGQGEVSVLQSSSYFSGSDHASVLLFNPNGGNVGIGTTNPTTALHVIGGLNCSSLVINGTPVATGTGSVWGTNGAAAYYTSGNVGIGTISPSNLLTVGSTATGYPSPNSAGTTNLVVYGNICCYRNRLIFSSALTDFNHCIYNNAGNLDGEGIFDGMKFNVYAGAWFRTGNAGGAVPTTALYIAQNGNVGIGLSTPGATVHVQSTSTTILPYLTTVIGETYALTSSSKNQFTPAGTIHEYSTNNTTSINTAILIDMNAYNSIGSATNVFFGAVAGSGAPGTAANFIIGRRTGVYSWAESLRIDTNGFVGIGTTTRSGPVTSLQVHGDFVGGFASTQFMISNSSVAGAQMGMGADSSGNGYIQAFLQGTGAKNLILNTMGGSVSIGSLGTGTVYSSGGVLTNTNPSDASLKTNIASLSNIDITQLNPIQFNWIDTATHDSKVHYGFLANEIQAVFPTIVSTWTDKDGAEKLGYDTVSLIPILTSVIKSQATKIAALESTLDHVLQRLAAAHIA